MVKYEQTYENGESTMVEQGKLYAVVSAPLAGTFYRSEVVGQGESEDQPFKTKKEPAIECGEHVYELTTIGFIEAMATFNAVNAGENGVVRHFLVRQGDVVDYGQPLALIEPEDIPAELHERLTLAMQYGEKLIDVLPSSPQLTDEEIKEVVNRAIEELKAKKQNRQ